MTCPAKHYSMGPCHLDAGHPGDHHAIPVSSAQCQNCGHTRATHDPDCAWCECDGYHAMPGLTWRQFKKRTSNVSFHAPAELSTWLEAQGNGDGKHAAAKRICLAAMKADAIVRTAFKPLLPLKLIACPICQQDTALLANFAIEGYGTGECPHCGPVIVRLD